jgi:hypothetical protein
MATEAVKIFEAVYDGEPRSKVRASRLRTSPLKMMTESGWKPRYQSEVGTFSHPRMPGHRLRVSSKGWAHFNQEGQLVARGPNKKLEAYIAVAPQILEEVKAVMAFRAVYEE